MQIVGWRLYGGYTSFCDKISLCYIKIYIGLLPVTRTSTLPYMTCSNPFEDKCQRMHRSQTKRQKHNILYSKWCRCIYLYTIYHLMHVNPKLQESMESWQISEYNHQQIANNARRNVFLLLGLKLSRKWKNLKSEGCPSDFWNSLHF